ncbi:hypothetical protein ANN_15280 [Periplaneta americana]|uniref:Uncharacterized protein n=1 Tax=Periplaneta americana TaxID=6978 RepID=A0ABQ8SG89_PERAM|nr:hypothetical protein ANN_15280 [Periplaneta americana]
MDCGRLHTVCMPEMEERVLQHVECDPKQLCKELQLLKHRFLCDELPMLLENAALLERQRMWFMHDWAQPHFLRIVQQYLTQTYHGQWIGRGSQVAWLPLSPDFNPLDFWLWGHWCMPNPSTKYIRYKNECLIHVPKSEGSQEEKQELVGSLAEKTLPTGRNADEEGEMHDLENDDSNAASDDSEIHDNDIVKKCDVSAGMSSDGEKDQKSCNKYSNNECSDRWTVIDIHRTGRHGPVSPPVIGEDLSERGLCYFKLPCNEDDDSTKEKPSMSREHEHNDDFVSESEEKLTSRPASVLPAELSATEKKAVSSEKMLRSDTKSLDLEHNINDVKSSLVPHHSNPKQETDVFENTFKISDIKASSTPNVTASVSHSTTRDCVGVKSSQPKQSDKSNARVLFPDNKNKHSAEILDENDILVCSKDEKIFEKDAEDSDEPDIIVTQPDSVIKKKSEHCLDTLKSKYCKNNKFVVTRMEVQSESKPKIFEVPSSSRGDTRRGHDKPISPEVITLE